MAAVIIVVIVAVALVATRRSGDNHKVNVTASDTSVTTTTATTSTTAPTLSESLAPASSTESPSAPLPTTTALETTTPVVETTPTTAPPAIAYGPNALLVMTNEGDHHTIWAINQDGSAQTKLRDQPDTGGSYGTSDIGWVPGHNQFAWHESPSNPGAGELHVANVDGSDEHVVDQHPPADETLKPWYSQWWSPDGRYVAEICALEDPHFWEPLCVLDTQTSQLRDLTTEFGLLEPADIGSDGLKPWFTPLGWDLTGRRLVYSEAREGQSTSIDVLDITNGQHWTIADEHAGTSAVVAADNESVLYERQDGVDGLQRVPIAGGTPQPVKGLIPGFRSPDGKGYLSRMYYGEAAQLGPPQIFNLVGDVVTVPVGGGDVVAAAW